MHVRYATAPLVGGGWEDYMVSWRVTAVQQHWSLGGGDKFPVPLLSSLQMEISILSLEGWTDLSIWTDRVDDTTSLLQRRTVHRRCGHLAHCQSYTYNGWVDWHIHILYIISTSLRLLTLARQFSVLKELLVKDHTYSSLRVFLGSEISGNVWIIWPSRSRVTQSSVVSLLVARFELTLTLRDKAEYLPYCRPLQPWFRALKLGDTSSSSSIPLTLPLSIPASTCSDANLFTLLTLAKPYSWIECRLYDQHHIFLCEIGNSRLVRNNYDSLLELNTGPLLLHIYNRNVTQRDKSLQYLRGGEQTVVPLVFGGILWNWFDGASDPITIVFFEHSHLKLLMLRKRILVYYLW